MILLTADKARLVTGPVVSSDLIISRNGARNTPGSKYDKSFASFSASFKLYNPFIRVS